MAKMGANDTSAVRTTMRGVRLTDAKYATVEKAAIERGFNSASAFIRAAIDHELDGVGRDTKLNEAENRIAASLERHSRDLFRLSRALRALFAVVDTLIKTFLTCVPEPPGEAKPQAVARAKERLRPIRKVSRAGHGWRIECNDAGYGESWRRMTKENSGCGPANSR